MDLCRLLHKLPSEVMAEDMELLQMLRIEELGRRRDEDDDVGGQYS